MAEWQGQYSGFSRVRGIPFPSASTIIHLSSRCIPHLYYACAAITCFIFPALLGTIPSHLWIYPLSGEKAVHYHQQRLSYSSCECKTLRFTSSSSSSSCFTKISQLILLPSHVLIAFHQKLLLIFSLSELAKPRDLAFFTTKQEEQTRLREYLQEKMILRNYMMVYLASNTSLNSER